MKTRLAISLLFLLACTTRGGAEESVLTFGSFGKVTLYRPSPHALPVVLFLSGDGGWNLGVVDMARDLASMGALVVGVDVPHYLRHLDTVQEECSYPAGDLEALSKFVQKSLGYPEYSLPIIVGYSSGATLAYATLAQSPPNTFAGAISMGFCPDLELKRPLCRGEGLDWRQGPGTNVYNFLPSNHLQSQWIVFQGAIDQVCNSESTARYVQETDGAELVLLPKVGHGFSVPRNWMPQFRNAFLRLAQKPQPLKEPEKPTNADIAGLPLVEVPAAGEPSDSFAVIVTGDGGWAGIDRQIGEFLASKGVPVVGFNSLQYFWTRRTPEESSRDLARVLQHYVIEWKKENVILVGYSFGADVLPFLADRLPSAILPRLKLIALLGPEKSADFEFHLTDWLGEDSDSARQVLPEVERLKGIRLLCVYGEKEEDSLCRDLGPVSASIVPISGGHHFGGEYQYIAQRILEEAGHQK